METVLWNICVYISLYTGIFISVFFLITLFEHKHELKSPLTNRFPSISVIIPAYNEEAGLAKTLDHILVQDYPKKRVEIIVVDDGSTDDTLKIARSYEKFGVRVFTKKNQGNSAFSKNYGAEKAKNEILVFIDADTFLEKDVFKKMVGYFDDPEVTAVCPTLQVSEPKNLIEKLQVIEYTVSFFFRKISSFMGSLNVTPSCSMYRSGFFAKHGGYDSNNLTEDFEIALRAQSFHYKIQMALDATVYTKVPDTLKKLMKQRLRWNYGTITTLIKYKNLIHTNHGDLGVLILPSMILSIGIMMLFAGLFLISNMQSLWDQIIFWYYTNFYFNFEFSLGGLFYLLTNPLYFIIFISILLSLIFFTIGKRKINENTFISWEYLVFIFCYGFLLMFSWGMCAFYMLIQKKPKW